MAKKEKRSKHRKHSGAEEDGENDNNQAAAAPIVPVLDTDAADPSSSTADVPSQDPNQTANSTNPPPMHTVAKETHPEDDDDDDDDASDSSSRHKQAPRTPPEEEEREPPADAPATRPRTLTRAQALAQLRKMGASSLGGAQVVSGGKADDNEGAQEKAEYSDASEDGAEGPEGDEGVFGKERRAHRRRSRHADSEGVALPGSRHSYRDAAADDGIGSHDDEGDGGEEASAPPNRSGRRSPMTMPTGAPQGTMAMNGASNAAALVPSQREDPNSLPRMLRLQRTFETNMGKLYSFCATHVTEWPALAVEWIPDRKFEDPERDYTLQYLALGTQTIKGAPNHVNVMEIAVPHDENSAAMYGLYGDDDIGPQNPGEFDPQAEVDPGKLFKNVRGHFRRDQAITLDTTVLKIRAMPAETNIIAATTGSGFIGVYNLVQDQHEDENGETIPDAILTGHKTGGFGLSWNIPKPGYIASGADDGYVNYWDIKHRITIDLKEEQPYRGGVNADGSTGGSPDLVGRECEPMQKLSGHRDIITDVSWHATQGHLLSSASLDGDVRIWDIRTNTSSVTLQGAHAGGVTASQFHPVGAFQLATAGMSGELCFWDIRRPKVPLLELNYHGRAVTGVQWAPFSETVIASYGEDGRVVVWDLAKTSLPLEYSADALAPPEVSFVHIGHLGVVTDFSWCGGRNDDWLMASTDSFNGVHVYKPKESVVRDYIPPELW